MLQRSEEKLSVKQCLSEIGVFGCLSVCCLISYKSGSVAAVSTYDPANVLATVTSHRRGLPRCHGIRDNPSGRFPSCLFRHDGYTGKSATLMARKIMSLSTWCLASCNPTRCFSCRPWHVGPGRLRLTRNDICGGHTESVLATRTASCSIIIFLIALGVKIPELKTKFKN